MARNLFTAARGLWLALALMVSIAAPAQAMPSQADSPNDLINAVNALRAANGLPPYSISPILMYTAQAQADFMAATGVVAHEGPGGISVTDRLLAAGYPLAGDLSLGGIRSENITAEREGSSSAQSAVNSWTGDAPHLNTMLSPNLTEIGAGVAIANGRGYYVIDTARPTTSGAPQAVTPSSAGGSAVPAGEAGELAIPLVVVSTPNAAGEVVHDVQAGQTLWQIAIAYGVKIDEIKSLNNLADNTIYPGETLLIKVEAVQASATPENTPAVSPTISPTLVATGTVMAVEETSVPALLPDSIARSNNTTIMSFVIGLVALVFLAGGYFAWRGEVNEDSG